VASKLLVCCCATVYGLTLSALSKLSLNNSPEFWPSRGTLATMITMLPMASRHLPQNVFRPCILCSPNVLMCSSGFLTKYNTLLLMLGTRSLSKASRAPLIRHSCRRQSYFRHLVLGRLQQCSGTFIRPVEALCHGLPVRSNISPMHSLSVLHTLRLLL